MIGTYGENFDEFVFRIPDARLQGDIVLNVESVNIPFIIDSGASINVIDSDTFQKIQTRNPSLKLQPTRTSVTAYTKKTTSMRGIIFCSVIRGNRRAVAVGICD